MVIRAKPWFRRWFVTVEPLRSRLRQEIGLAIRTIRGIFLDTIGTVWTKPHPRGGFSNHDLPSLAQWLTPSSYSARQRGHCFHETVLKRHAPLYWTFGELNC